jgi:hypothetical protein
MTNDTTNKPTKEEAIKVIRYLMANDVELMLGPSMASNGYTEIDEESIGRFMDSPITDWKMARDCHNYNTTPDIIKQWESEIVYGDFVMLQCCGLTTKGKLCKNTAMECSGFEQWLANKDTPRLCELHTKAEKK